MGRITTAISTGRVRQVAGLFFVNGHGRRVCRAGIGKNTSAAVYRRKCVSVKATVAPVQVAEPASS